MHMPVCKVYHRFASIFLVASFAVSLWGSDQSTCSRGALVVGSAGLPAADGAPVAVGDVDRNAGRRILTALQLDGPSDISWAVVDGYKITWKDDPGLVTRLYAALGSIVSIPEFKSTGAWGTLILNLSSGRTVWFAFEERRDALSGYDVFLTESYHSRALLPVLADIYKDEEAAARDATLGPIEPVALEAVIPEGRRVEVRMGGRQADLIIQRATAICDWLDVRDAGAKALAPEEVEAIGKQDGLLYLTLSHPVRIELMLWDEASRPRGFPDPYATNISFADVVCDRIVVVGGSRGGRPKVGFREVSTGSYYLSQFRIARRESEAYGVKNRGFPGRPLNDVEYYKRPEKVWRELLEILKAAAKGQ